MTKPAYILNISDLGCQGSIPAVANIYIYILILFLQPQPRPECQTFFPTDGVEFMEFVEQITQAGRIGLIPRISGATQKTMRKTVLGEKIHQFFSMTHFDAFLVSVSI